MGEKKKARSDETGAGGIRPLRSGESYLSALDATLYRIVGNGGREIPMLQEVRATLENLYQMHKENHLEPLEIDGKSYDLVFRNRVHGILMPSSINQAIKRIVKSYNEVHPTNCLPYFSVHQMRHTFATRLCENCTNMKAIQEIMGHASIRTTMDVYATSTKESRRHTLDELQGKCVIF